MSSHSPSPPEPGVFDLFVGPFLGLTVYRRAANAGLVAAFGVMALGLLAGAAVLGAAQFLTFSATLDAMEDSAISFAPRVNIVDGWATVEAANGRIIETDRLVVLYDTSPEPADVPKGFGDDVRPRILVGDRAMLLFTPDRPVPLALPWTQVNQALGRRVSVDGRELIEALRRAAPRAVLTIGAIITALLLVWELILVGVVVGMHRLLFGRRIGAPGPGHLFVTACLASLPAVVVGVLVVLTTSRQEWALLGHGATLGGLVLLAGNTLHGLPPRRRAVGDGVTPAAVASEL